MAFSTFSGDPDRSFLPNYVFGYYSGYGNRMEEHFRRHQRRFYDDLIHGVDRPLRPMLYARPVHSQFVLLAFFVERDERALEFLKDYLGIEALESVLFIMREPEWPSRSGDPRFWNARGAVSRFLSELYRLALAPLRLERRIEIGFRQYKRLEHLYLFIKDLPTIASLREVYGTQQELFKALESTYISDLMSEVRVRVRAVRSNGALTFRELSEGEQQLLMVLGLLRFTREEESLFLLDEPDTHLNPNWSIEYLDLLQRYGGAGETSHLIMATHDPLVIAGLTKPQVRIFHRDEDTLRISVEEPDQDPRGMGIAGLLTSDIYGLRSQLDLKTLELLDEKRKLAAKERLSEEDVSRLRELNRELEDIDMAPAVRDPLYRKFVEAMTAWEDERGVRGPSLSYDEQHEERARALEIVRSLEREQGPDPSSQG